MYSLPQCTFKPLEFIIICGSNYEVFETEEERSLDGMCRYYKAYMGYEWVALYYFYLQLNLCKFNIRN